MGKPIAPCKDCEKRHFRCFSECSKYASYMHDKEEYSKAVFEKKKHENQAAAVSVARSDRANKALRRYKK